jgi:hypothetical protein
MRKPLLPSRRVGGLEQGLGVAAPEHGRDIAGAGGLRSAVGIDLHRDRRRREAGPRQRGGRGGRIADEMAHMVEEDFIAGRQLAIRLQSFALRHRSLSLIVLQPIVGAGPGVRAHDNTRRYRHNLCYDLAQ